MKVPMKQCNRTIMGCLPSTNWWEIRGLHGDCMQFSWVFFDGISVVKIIYHMCIQWMLNGYMIGMDL